MLAYNHKTKEEMEMISPLHKQIQGFISLMANRKCGCEDPEQIKGILKCEGGVTVNKCEICIKEDYVMDDWKRPRDPSIEEKAVVDVIHEMFDAIDFTSKDRAMLSLIKHMGLTLSQEDHVRVTQFANSPFAGDNLLSFFKVMW